MRTAQITASQTPTVLFTSRNRATNDYRTLKSSNLAFPCLAKHSLSLKRRSFSSLGLKLKPVLNSTIVCLSNSGSGSNSEGSSPWKAFEKALGNVTGGKSIEEVLKQQIEKREFYPDSGGGGGRGGGDGGGGFDGFDGPEDDDFKAFWDEAVQVFLATSAFILLYIYIISGEELMKLVMDFFMYVFKGTESARLKKVLDKWRPSLKSIINDDDDDDEEEDSFWLERAIINTPTWYDSPEKYRQIFGFGNETASSSKAKKEQDPEPREELNPEDDDYGYNDNDNDNDNDDNGY